MNINVAKVSRSFWALGACFAPLLAAATGFRLPDQDAFATARGEAFAATADNASAIYYNPAGLGQLEGDNFRAGVYGIFLDATYESPAGGEFDNEEDLHAVPQIFYSHSFEKVPLALGLGVYSAYGLSSEWPDGTGFRTVGTQARLTTLTINPVLAWRIVTNLSVAAGITVNYANTDLRQGLFWPAQAYDQFRFEGDGWAPGYNLGVLWKPWEKLSFGASFRSAMTVSLEGHTKYYNRVDLPLPGGGAIPAFPEQKVGAEADFPFPMNAIFGVSYRPTPAWNFEFNADYADWSAVDRLDIHQSRGFAPLVPQDVSLSLGWEPSWYYEFGATRYLGGGWTVSAGYIFNENSVPDTHYNPLVADLDRHFLSIGTGFKGRKIGFDVAYQFGYGPERTVRGSAASPSGQTADGKYEFISHAVLVTLGYQF
jgi:long-chain fatty acid transport protein